MSRAGEILLEAVRQLRRRFVLLLVTNVVAALLSIPFAVLYAAAPFVPHSRGAAPLFVAMLIAVLPTPSCVGLQHVARELSRGDVMYLGEQWTGFARAGVRAFGVWAVSFLGTAVVLANIATYAGLHSAVGTLLVVVWAYVLLAWVSLHLYVYPLLLRDEWTGLWRVYRDAFVMLATRPGVTSLLALVWVGVLALTALSVLIGFFGLALGALIQQNAVRSMLADATGGRLVPSDAPDL